MGTMDGLLPLSGIRCRLVRPKIPGLADYYVLSLDPDGPPPEAAAQGEMVALADAVARGLSTRRHQVADLVLTPGDHRLDEGATAVVAGVEVGAAPVQSSTISRSRGTPAWR